MASIVVSGHVFTSGFLPFVSLPLLVVMAIRRPLLRPPPLIVDKTNVKMRIERWRTK